MADQDPKPDRQDPNVEEPGDTAPVGDDHGRSRGGGLGCDDAEALARRGQDEHVRLGIEVVRRLLCHRERVDSSQRRRLLLCALNEL